MKIGIIGAMEEEVLSLISEMEIEDTIKKCSMEFNVGKLQGKHVVVVKCGIGKVNAAICAQVLIDDFGVNQVINVGVAGGINKEIFPGDVVISNNLVQHDMDTTAFGDKVGQIPRMDTFDFKCDDKLVENAKTACKDITKYNVFVGRIVSGDQFIANVEKIKWLEQEFGAIACEMEGASIAQACYLNNVPFIVIRSISDNANNGAHSDFEKFKHIAVANSLDIIRNMLKNM